MTEEKSGAEQKKSGRIFRHGAAYEKSQAAAENAAAEKPQTEKEDCAAEAEKTECCDKSAREAELEKENAELKDKYLRLAADFDNFRKRSSKDSADRTNRAVEAFAVEVLDIADNIERALKADDKSMREGVVQIQKVINKILSNHSISPIEALNAQFDPKKHEAIAYVPSDKADGIVIDELIRGYTIGEKILRCSKVAVSKGKEE